MGNVLSRGINFVSSFFSTVAGLFHASGLGILGTSKATSTVGGGFFSPTTFDVDAYRKHAHEMVDYIADYYSNLESLPVLPSVEPGYLKKALPSQAPEEPEPFGAIMDDVNRHIMPGMTHWQSPNFFAYFPANSSPPAMIADMLSTGFNVIGFSWITSPACTELETIVLDWLGKAIGLPEGFLSNKKGGGIIQGTASEATAVALLSARAQVVRESKAASPSRFRVYASDQAHSSVKKACMIAGLDADESFVPIKTFKSNGFAIDAEEAKNIIEADIKKGCIPVMFCATLGTTSSCAVDPIRRIGEICKANGIWLHVDAAYAGSACICPENQRFLDGIELADSIDTNPHKWLLTNFDCSTMWVQNRSALIDALTVQPEYLRNKASELGLVVDYKDWQIPLGRRFRALKLWFVLRSYGIKGLQSYIRNHIALARRFESHVAADSRFELSAPVDFGLVCFRLKGDTTINEKLRDAVNDSKDIFIIHSIIGDEFILRFAVCSPQTTEDHVDRAWKIISSSATKLLG